MGQSPDNSLADRRPMRGTRCGSCAALIAGLLLTAGVVPASQVSATPTRSAVTSPISVRAAGAIRALPPRSVRHKNSRYWVWFAPRNWTSIDSSQGITITSGNGLLNIDDGFSSTLCARGNTADESIRNYFAAQRQALRAALGANWNRPTMNTGPIRQMPAALWGKLYFRQTVVVSGGSGGIRFQGIVRYDYSLATGPTYCFARSTALTAPAQGFDVSISQLRSVQASQAYFGPGLPPGPNGEPA